MEPQENQEHKEPKEKKGMMVNLEKLDYQDHHQV